MALVISLKPNEKLIISGAVIQNGDLQTRFRVENTVSVLREKDILKENEADTPAKRLYFLIQLVYIDEPDRAGYERHFWAGIREFIQAAPSAGRLIHDICDSFLDKQYYRSLKAAKKLIQYESRLLSRASPSQARRPEIAPLKDPEDRIQRG